MDIVRDIVSGFLDLHFWIEHLRDRLFVITLIPLVVYFLIREWREFRWRRMTDKERAQKVWRELRVIRLKMYDREAKFKDDQSRDQLKEKHLTWLLSSLTADIPEYDWMNTGG